MTPWHGPDGTDQATLDEETENLQSENHFVLACFNTSYLGQLTEAREIYPLELKHGET